MKSFYPTVIFTLIIIGIAGCLGTSEPLPEQETENLNRTQIQSQLNGTVSSARLTGFDYMRSSQHQPDVYRLDWSAVREIRNDNEVIWEVPVVSRYRTAMLAGRKNGELFQPSRLHVQQHMLFRKNGQSGEISGEIWTFLGKNTEGIHADNLTSWEGFVILSDLKGESGSTYQIHNGQMTRILAGNAELQKQKEDFYCFCFEVDDWMPLTRIGYENDDTTVIWIICEFCNRSLEMCNCNRCPDCGNTPSACICNICHICKETKDRCSCQSICNGCGKPSYLCECTGVPSEPITPIPTCPLCQQNPCVCSSPTPGGECKCTNIYCPGGSGCNCRYLGNCSCQACLSGNCKCLPRTT